jgi:integrase
MAGNIVKVKEGSYRLRYKDYSKYVKAKTDSQAERLLAAFVTEIDKGDFSQPSKITFKEFAQKWLKEYGEIELAPKTVFRYKQLLTSRIYPAIGDKKLEKIKPLDLVKFYNSMRGEHKFQIIDKDGDIQDKLSPGLSEKTIKHHHSLINTIFERAIKWNVLKGDNPAKRVDAPKVERKKASCYNEEQTQALLKALDSLDDSETKYKVATILALMTGARLGEIMGLEWQDIDFTNKVIEIRQSSQYVPGKGVFTKAPKTETSKRRISVNTALLKLLEDYKEGQRQKGFICQDNNRLFITWEGKPMYPYALTEWFPQFLKKNNLPHLNFHGLRHTAATFLISNGLDIQTVAGRLGHSTSATTQNVYSHFLESKDREAAKIIEKAFGEKKKSKKSLKGTK